MADLCIVDEKSFARPLQLYAKDEGLEVLVFTDSLNCLRYLQSCADDALPRAYFVNLHSARDTDWNNSLQIYSFLRGKDKIERFYFMSTYLEEKDLQEIKEIEARFLSKSDVNVFFDLLESFRS